MPDISFNDVVKLSLNDSWRVVEKNAELVLVVPKDSGDAVEDNCQIQFRLMKVAAKSAEQRQQLLLSALDTATPEQVSDSIFWTREKNVATDDEGLMQRWLLAVTKNEQELSLIIIDLNVPADDGAQLETLGQELEEVLRQAI
ncbi:MAG: hypothetical protein ACFHVJ_09205 [Aestuariibacter sp.]